STETPSEEAPTTGGETPSTETPSEEAPATGGETPSTETPSQTAPSAGAPTQTVPETQVPTGSTPSTEVKTPAVETPQVNTPEEGKTETVKTEEKVAVTGITLEKKIKVGKGGKYQLTAVVAPANATNTEIEWTTSDKKIATVSSTGLVKAKKKGSATITATTRDGGFKAEVKVIVKDAIKVTGVKLNKKSKTIKVGKSYTLKATIKPKKATITDVTWFSSNKKVAKVDKEGNVTAIGKGTATITVKTKDGKYTATCKITVKK
uniref:Ig-like domain-containing protein n=1 Tax=Butyrivibrio sp. LC3010 TaxID=1280680 RepID=UPI00067813FF